MKKYINYYNIKEKLKKKNIMTKKRSQRDLSPDKRTNKKYKKEIPEKKLEGWDKESYGKPYLIKKSLKKPEVVVLIVAYIPEEKNQVEIRLRDSCKVAIDMATGFKKINIIPAVIFMTNQPKLYKNKVLTNVEELWTLETNANNPNTRRGYGLRLGHFLYSSIPHFLCDGRRKLTEKSDLKKITVSVQNFSDDGKTVGYFNQQDGRAGFNIWCTTQVVAFKPPLNRYWDIPKCFDENPGCILEDFTAIGYMLKLGCSFVKLDGRKWSVSKKKKRRSKKKGGGTKSLLRPNKGIKG